MHSHSLRLAPWLLIAITVVAAAFLGTTRAHAQQPTLFDSLPPNGGVALISWTGGSPTDIGNGALADGCRATSVWAADGGSFLGYRFGAPSFVNAAFNARFPGDDIPARPLLLVCERRIEATARLGVLAGDVSDAIRDRDHDRIRDQSGDQLMLRTQDQDRLHVATCVPAGGGFALLSTTPTVEGATARVEARFRVDQPAGGQFEHTRTWSFRWQLDGGWALDELPLCPYAASAATSQVEAIAAQVTRHIRDRDQVRLQDLADDPERNQQRTEAQRQERLHLVDQLALCRPEVASLEVISMQTVVVANTATVTARLRLQDGPNLSEVQQNWQFRRTMQNQWRLDEVPPCPFAHDVTTLTAANDGTTVTLDIRDRLHVTLDGNPTTGFTWEVDGAVPESLVQLGQPLFVPESDLIGAGGEFTFRFEAVASGSGTLRLIYHRPFETVAPADTFEVTVVVP